MNKIALLLLYTSSVLMFIGGLADQFINGYLDVHLNFLGNPENSALLSGSERLSIFLLHSVGAGLMSTGISMFFLTHFAIRRDLSWAKWVFLTIAWVAQGINGYNMYAVGSHYWYPVLLLVMATIGALTFKAKSSH